MKNFMKRRAKILLIVSMIFLVQINGAITCMAYKSRDEYEDAIQKIYEQMDSFTFFFTQSITYSVHFGGMFEKYNETHKRFTADVFVITENEYYVSSLAASLTFNITFSATGINIIDSGSDGDTSSFMQYGDVIYEFEIYELFVHQNLFPVTLTINFDYVLSSSEFYQTDSYSVTQNFDWDPLLIGIIIASVIGAIVVITAVAIIFVLLRRRKKRRIQNDTPYKPISPA